MSLKNLPIHIVGAGLAGSECALQLASMNYEVHLYEMRGKKQTPAHKSSNFAELVCSNSFGSTMDYAAPGQLKWEAEKYNSFILKAAYEARVPAGMALGVDREVFSELVTKEVQNHPKITIHNKVVESLDQVPRPTVIATGPLTDESLAKSMQEHFGGEFLYFFDAIAPILDADTINDKIAWKASRWDKGTADYYNCPLNKEQYYNLIEEIKAARVVEAKNFEQDTPYFDACLPIEELVRRGDETPRFGPMSPKGLRNPITGENEYAIVQLRQDNRAATAFNMVGFQTKMAYGEQKRIFRMIPGLEEAEFLKLGSIHRNLYINSPKLLNSDLSSCKDPNLYFAGQITGVEGYFESTCTGFLVAHFLHQKMQDMPMKAPARETALGSLLFAITQEEKENFQPTNINFGLFPPLETKRKMKKADKKEAQIARAQKVFKEHPFLNTSKVQTQVQTLSFSE